MGDWVIGVLISGVLLICCRLIIISFALWLVIEAIGTFLGGLEEIRLLIDDEGIKYASHRGCFGCFIFMAIIFRFSGVLLGV